ncbi:hypothetical protein L195_g034867 [Trifolium pratense]|uniref:Uncharacterized protein n=1 Tax=Trifolium pratense TaxID=57577 RepID=A0A2K3LK24_TRIPR|nr:hypothetical protein L195_g034867 [Trifolium pratense]
MVSSPQLRSTAYRSSHAFAAVLVPEKSERYLDYDSADEYEEDATSVDVTDSVFANIVQAQDSDFAAMEERNSEFLFGSFSQDSESEMVQIIPIETIKPSIEGRSIKIGEIDCFLLASESELVAERKEQGFVFEDDEFVPSCNEESFMEYQDDTTFGSKNWFNLPQLGASDDDYAITNSRTTMFIFLPPYKVRFSSSKLEKLVSATTTLKHINFFFNLCGVYIEVFDPGGIMSVLYNSAIMLSTLLIFNSISLFPFDPGGTSENIFFSLRIIAINFPFLGHFDNSATYYLFMIEFILEVELNLDRIHAVVIVTPFTTL